MIEFLVLLAFLAIFLSPCLAASMTGLVDGADLRIRILSEPHIAEADPIPIPSPYVETELIPIPSPYVEAELVPKLPPVVDPLPVHRLELPKVKRRGRDRV